MKKKIQIKDIRAGLLALALVLIPALCGAWTARAQELSVEAPNLVEAGESFNVSFVYDGSESVSDFKWDGGQDFLVVWGPQQGSSTSVSIVNGKMTKTVRRSYTYVLQAPRAGVFTLPAATLQAKGRTLSSPQRQIEVVGARPQGGNARPGAAAPGQSQDAQAVQAAEDDIIFRMIVDKDNVVLGEPVRVTLKLYQRVNISGLDDAKLPSFNGFWSQDVTPQRDIQFVRENYKGAIYNAAVIKDYVLIPQRSGGLAIEPAELTCLVYQRVSQNTGSIFDGFFDDYTTIRKRVATQARTIKVSPLPQPSPKGFCGGVGKFDMEVKVSRDSLKTHEAASLFVTVKGRGNLSLLEAPKVQFPPDFELYDPKVTENLDKASGSISGSRTWEFPFIPRSYGDFTLPAIDYAYYDISSKQYVSLKSAAIELYVEKTQEADGAGGGTQIILQGSNKKGVKDLGSDIRFIHTRNTGLKSETSFFVSRPLFSVLAWGLCVLALCLGLLQRMHLRRNADQGAVRTRKANRMAKKRLKAARGYLDNALSTAFYEELHKALQGYACDKLGLPLADLTRENVQEAFLGRGARQEDVAAYLEIVEACEMARYSRSGGQQEMRALFDKAEQTISELDSCMTDKKSVSKATLILLAFLLLGAAPARSADYVDSLWNKAVSDYSEGRYLESEKAFASIDALGLSSADLEYNRGNACFKAGNLGHAILHYEKALKRNPSMKDARYNLEMANAQTVDDIEAVPAFLPAVWLRNLGYILPSDVWAALFLILLGVALTGALLFFFAPELWRKIGFFAGLAALLLSFVCFAYARAQAEAFNREDAAIVLRSVAEVKSSPSEDNVSNLFVLHEGTKVKLLDTVGEWKNIELSDGRQGWMRARELGII
ncbi:MAG: BatD family protein [Bacteroidales bacterium]|nr:BatD family protein [Bacteroidales bacterium]